MPTFSLLQALPSTDQQALPATDQQARHRPATQPGACNTSRQDAGAGPACCMQLCARPAKLANRAGGALPVRPYGCVHTQQAPTHLGFRVLSDGAGVH